ncbi:MAG TPA: hypothetical protein VGN69_11025 [Solirubrobacteraceae bacterium]|nr:hypothetical protein [Solirubrobacteraceae bacterium]
MASIDTSAGRRDSGVSDDRQAPKPGGVRSLDAFLVLFCLLVMAAILVAAAA